MFRFFRRLRLSPAGIRAAGLGWALLHLIMAGAAGAEGVLVELENPPTARVYLQEAAKGSTDTGLGQTLKSAQRTILQEQSRFRTALTAKSTEARELFAVQRVCNAIALRVAPELVGELGGLPGVKRVTPLTVFTMDIATSGPFIGVPDLWEGLPNGLTGAGIRVGVVDTGIDYLHQHFGGSGRPADHRDNDTTRIDDGLFPTLRVAGGFDFVGEAYNPVDPEHDVPQPDPDPMDQNGHGTHVAGILGGNGVTLGNLPYTGPYTGAVLNQLQLAPGMAPAVTLYALKIFSASLQSDVLLPAIEWALDPDGDGDFSDRLDVLNLSLGEPFGPADAIEAQACDLAAQMGIAVIASAGNSGDTYYITSMPGSAAWVLSVAACEDDDPGESGLDPFQLASFSSRGPAQSHGEGTRLKPDLTAPGSRIRSAAAFVIANNQISRLLSGTSMAAPHVAGVAALLLEQDPTLTIPQLKALLMNTASRDVFRGPEQVPPRSGPPQAGMGAVDALAAATSDVILYNTANPAEVSLTFQEREVVDTLTRSASITVENLGTEMRRFRSAIDSTVDIPGVTITLAPEEIAVGGGMAETLTLTLTANRGDMAHSRDPAAGETVTTRNRHWISEATGYVALQPLTAGPELRMGYYAALRPASTVAAAATAFEADSAGVVELSFDGSTFNQGDAVPEDEAALRSIFQWLHTSDTVPDLEGLERMGDLAHVGYAIVADPADSAAALLVVAVTTHGEWFTPNWVQFEVEMDFDGDGETDATLYNSSDQSTPGTGVSLRDVFITRLRRGDANAIVGRVNLLDAQDRATAPFHSDVLFLPVPLAALGEGVDDFHIRVGTYLFPGLTFPPLLARIDETPWLAVSASAPLITGYGNAFAAPLDFDSTGAGQTLQVDPAFLEADIPPRLLVLHHHNQVGSRSEVVAIQQAMPPPVQPGCGGGAGVSRGADGLVLLILALLLCSGGLFSWGRPGPPR